MDLYREVIDFFDAVFLFVGALAELLRYLIREDVGAPKQVSLNKTSTAAYTKTAVSTNIAASTRTAVSTRTPASKISSTVDDEEELELRKRNIPSTSLNELCDPDEYRPKSWTIFLYDSKRKAGGTVWCRVWLDEGNGCNEMRVKDIFPLIRMIIQQNPDSCFYIKTVGRDNQESLFMFESNLIVRALTKILKKAKRSSSIVVPNKEDLLNPLRKEKRGFVASLRFGARGQKSVN